MRSGQVNGEKSKGINDHSLVFIKSSYFVFSFFRDNFLICF